MKALSLSQPWLWAVLHAGKHVENRTWQPPIAMIGQQILLHAAKSWDDKKLYPVHVAAQQIETMTPIGYLLYHGITAAPSRRDMYPSSSIVGIATIDRVVTKADTLPEDQRRWFFGPFGWVLTNVLSLPRPVPCKGGLGLWNVRDDIVAEVREMAAA